MAQRYKVFINEKLLQLSTAEQSDILNIKFTPENVPGEKLSNWAAGVLEQPVNLVCGNINEAWDLFKSHFVEIVAAGGAVFNNNGALLWINRLSKWDLPKGKVEAGEAEDVAAVREVMEECSIQQVALNEKLLDTYHVYQLKGKPILKRTAWYRMQLIKGENLKPQTEEDITEVGFFEPKVWPDLLAQSYLTIAEVINSLDEIKP